MKIWLGTADTDVMQKYASLPIAGIITNPSIISKEYIKLREKRFYAKGAVKIPPDMVPFRAVLGRINDIPTEPPLDEIHLQILSQNKAEIIEQIHFLTKHVKNRRVIAKIPFCSAGLEAAKELQNENIQANITAVCTLAQAQMVVRFRAEYMSVYVARINDAFQDPDNAAGYVLIRKIREYIDRVDGETEIIAASIRTPQQYEQVIQEGADGVAVSPELFDECMQCSLTEQSLQSFAQEWKEACDT